MGKGDACGCGTRGGGICSADDASEGAENADTEGGVLGDRGALGEYTDGRELSCGVGGDAGGCMADTTPITEVGMRGLGGSKGGCDGRGIAGEGAGEVRSTDSEFDGTAGLVGGADGSRSGGADGTAGLAGGGMAGRLTRGGSGGCAGTGDCSSGAIGGGIAVEGGGDCGRLGCDTLGEALLPSSSRAASSSVSMVCICPSGMGEGSGSVAGTDGGIGGTNGGSGGSTGLGGGQ